jgi:hypothetical protein
LLHRYTCGPTSFLWSSRVLYMKTKCNYLMAIVRTIFSQDGWLHSKCLEDA